MNKLTLTTFVSLFLLSAGVLGAQVSFLSISSSGLRADEELQGFGYTSHTVKEISVISTKSTDYAAPLIKIKAPGANKVTGVSFYAERPDDQGMIIVLSGDGSKALYTEPCSIKKGVNNITLKTPYVTSAGKDYLIGFVTKPKSNKQSDVLVFSKGFDIREGNYILLSQKKPQSGSEYDPNKSIVNTAGQRFGTLPLFVTLEDMSIFHNMGYLTSVEGNFEGVKPDSKISAKLQVLNIGTNDIKDIELTYQYGDTPVKTLSQTLSAPIASYQSGDCTFEIPAEVVGLGALTITISKINGVASQFAKVTQQRLAYEIGDNDARKRETILMERFTTESCQNCPPAEPSENALAAEMEKAGYRVSRIQHHSGFKTDFLTLSEDEQILSYMYDPAEGGTYAPALSINRTCVNSTRSLVDGFTRAAIQTHFLDRFDDEKKRKEGAIIEAIDSKLEGDKIKVTIKGKALKNAFIPDDVYLTALLTEDHIQSQKQSGASRAHKHSHVPRAYMTSAFGEKLSLEADGSFTKSYEIALNKVWKTDNCHIVAFVHRNLKATNPQNRQVYVAETALLYHGLPIEAIHTTDAPTVTIENGYLTVHGTAETLEVYDMQGILVSDSVKTQLSAGVYLVRLQSDLRSYTYKVVVR